MQFTKSYIDRYFALTAPFDLKGAGLVLPPGTVGRMDAFDPKKGEVRLEFQLEGRTPAKAWVSETVLALANPPVHLVRNGVDVVLHPDGSFPAWVVKYGPGLIPVDSSHIKAIGFFDVQGADIADSDDPRDDTGDVVIAYKDGKGYRFPKVTRKAWTGLLAADSKGQFVAMKLGSAGEKLEE